MRLDPIIRFFTSLRLTVACLAIGMLLVFAGTIAQVDLGLYKAQNDFFRSFFVYWQPRGSAWRIPVFPGGYLLGTTILVNLICAHIKRFSLSGKKIGIWLAHFGLMLLIVGQLATDMLSRESVLHLREGEAKNYSETERQAELAVVELGDKDTDKVIAIPQPILARKGDIAHPDLPFTVRVKEFFPNSAVEEIKPESKATPATDRGLGTRATVRQSPHVTSMDERDVPSAILELAAGGSSLGTWLVSEFIERPQRIDVGGKTYELSLRPQRHYKPFTLQLIKFSHELYPGTDTPRKFSSRVVLNRPDTGEHRELDIYMNTPLRYAGETFYQASFDRDDKGTVLQVVRNPSWLAPYFACILVALGLIVQFLRHLVGFAAKWRTA